MVLIKWLFIDIASSSMYNLGPISSKSIRASFIFVFYLIFVFYTQEINVKSPLDYLMRQNNTE